MKRQRILFLIPSSSVIGGVETWLNRVTPYLAQQGWDPFVGLAQGLRYNLPREFQAMYPGLPTVIVDGRGLDQEGRIREVLRCIRKVKPETIVPLGLHDAFWAACQWKQQVPLGRLVLRNQGLLPPLLADLRCFAPGADLVVCDSRLMAQFAVTHAAVPQERVWNIPNGADLVSDALLERRHQTSKQPDLRLGYIGRLTQGDKRVLDLLPLCRLMRQRKIPFTLDIVGDGPAEDELRRGLDCSEYHGSIRFHGRLAHQQVLSTIYPRLDVLLLLSSSESFGIVLVEAMMHGVVPVTSQYLGFFTERLVVDGKNGLSFQVGDMASAAECIARLAEDRGFLATLAEQGRIRMNREFTWQRALGLWEQALEWVREQEPVAARSESARVCPVSGLLNQWGIPPGVTHALRRLRRRFLGVAIPAGGEEWPLFGKRYAEADLSNLAKIVQDLERQAAAGA